jgi:hypothetical protein
MPMYVEHRTYSITPGRVPEYLAGYGPKGFPIQKRYLGDCCIGSYVTEIGTVQEITMMWRFDTIDTRMERKAANDKDPDWQVLMLDGLTPFIERIVTKMIAPAPFWHDTDIDGSRYAFVEQRAYAIKPGRVGAYLSAYGERGFEMQKRHFGDTSLGVWTSEVGTIQEVTMFWGFGSLDQRMAMRRANDADPEWQALNRDVLAPNIARAVTKMMSPTPYWVADQAGR